MGMTSSLSWKIYFKLTFYSDLFATDATAILTVNAGDSEINWNVDELSTSGNGKTVQQGSGEGTGPEIPPEPAAQNRTFELDIKAATAKLTLFENGAKLFEGTYNGTYNLQGIFKGTWSQSGSK